MIDRQKRDHLSHRLRLLAAGQITNDAFEDSLNIKSDDPAIWRIYHDGAWTLYSDLREYKLIGTDKLTDEVKKNVARVILFLTSDREFEWQEPTWYMKAMMFVLGLLTFNAVPRWYYKTVWGKQGDFEVWPYIRRSDFETDLQKQPYLKSNENR